MHEKVVGLDEAGEVARVIAQEDYDVGEMTLMHKTLLIK